MEVRQSIHCGWCRAPLPEPVSTPPPARQPCPRCAATSRIVDVVARDGLTLHDWVETRARHRHTGRPFHEGFAGEDQWRVGGRWMQKRRVIDRDRDYYFEEVIDPGTGTVIHRCEEPLSEHRGHESAKTEDP